MGEVQDQRTFSPEDEPRAESTTSAINTNADKPLMEYIDQKNTILIGYKNSDRTLRACLGEGWQHRKLSQPLLCPHKILGIENLFEVLIADNSHS